MELVLLTVILGLAASIASPFFAEARERAMARRATEDVRRMTTAIESYLAATQEWPLSVEELVARRDYAPDPDIRYCMFRLVPGSETRSPYILLSAVHRAGRRRIVAAYPLWGGRTVETESTERGC